MTPHSITQHDTQPTMTQHDMAWTAHSIAQHMYDVWRGGDDDSTDDDTAVLIESHADPLALQFRLTIAQLLLHGTAVQLTT